ncbi:hypothetical protein GYMLUDRAFT_943871 [Collybiopsis luxurians FD-317 M1]|uniref:Uncharacterized protein n=1 Tax=Collybiopsis luxurians FD-317 M1 TaxID=944289 RepID=A0A0D0CDR9_9AGAR|nr:hypothetical protein GYMLUDRAFT_943871 [Collybiopsis luxurians FD-317 M1]
MFLIKKAKNRLNNLKHRRGNVNASGSAPGLRNVAQDSHAPRNSESDVSQPKDRFLKSHPFSAKLCKLLALLQKQASRF